ncbi:MAG: ribulose-phosphate 3-epimerase, partial [Endomicrobia bacterium]|nr:ribulose-phosphate 3-epimerase [Endomicrobiia bacterium]
PHEVYLEYINAGGDLLVFHYETVNNANIKKLINDIKTYNVFCGISIKPDTPVDKIIPYLNILDLVLIMTVEPGFGGQKIITDCLEKVVVLNKYRMKKKLNFLISCDGGINQDNIVEIIKMGCDIPVVGSAIFNSENFVEKTKFFNLLTKKIKFNKIKNKYES